MQQSTTTTTNETTLGALVVEVYAEFLVLYGDEELASVAAAAVVNSMIADNAGENS